MQILMADNKKEKLSYEMKKRRRRKLVMGNHDGVYSTTTTMLELNKLKKTKMMMTINTTSYNSARISPNLIDFFLTTLKIENRNIKSRFALGLR